MTKKAVKKEVVKREAPLVSVKIAISPVTGSPFLSENGTQVSMTEKDYRFVQDTLRRKSKALTILSTYLANAELNKE